MRSLFLAKGIELAKKDAKGHCFNEICYSNILWGRPDWDFIFKRQTLLYRRSKEVKTKVGVFVCGNSMLVDDIYEVCENYNTPNIKYELNVEHF